MERPAVDVVTPFAGTDQQLDRLLASLGAIELRERDTVTVADNRSGAPDRAAAGVQVIGAGERRSSYHARNRGASLGAADWIVFLDADVDPPPDLLDRYFEPPPGERTAVLGGGIVDQPARDGDSLAIRYSAARGTLDHRNTLLADWAYAQTANCAVRRAAFSAVGGFRDDIRSAGDADLCFRLRSAGWGLELREGAAVVHRNRPTVRGLLRQRLRHGSGSGWLDRHYPGSAPGHGNLPGLAKWTVQSGTSLLRRSGGGGGGLDARMALMDLAVNWAMELGRFLPNEVRR